MENPQISDQENTPKKLEFKITCDGKDFKKALSSLSIKPLALILILIITGLIIYSFSLASAVTYFILITFITFAVAKGIRKGEKSTLGMFEDMGTTFEYTVDEKGIQVKYQLGEKLFRWEKLSGFKHREGFLFVYYFDHPVLIIPTEQLSREETEDLNAYLSKIPDMDRKESGKRKKTFASVFGGGIFLIILITVFIIIAMIFTDILPFSFGINMIKVMRSFSGDISEKAKEYRTSLIIESDTPSGRDDGRTFCVIKNKGNKTVTHMSFKLTFLDNKGSYLGETHTSIRLKRSLFAADNSRIVSSQHRPLKPNQTLFLYILPPDVFDPNKEKVADCKIELMDIEFD